MVQAKASTRWVTGGPVPNPGELEKTMLQAIAGPPGGHARAMASPGLLAEIHHMPDPGRSLNRPHRTSEAAPITQISAP
jgi:hypothetical protein